MREDSAGHPAPDWELGITGTASIPVPLNEEQGGPRGGRLVMLKGAEPGRMFRLTDDNLVGRDPECEIRVASRANSRRHARISREGPGEFVLTDLGSKNGTLVNGARVTVQTLAFGDRIQLSPETIFLFTYEDELQDQLWQSQKMEAMGRLVTAIVHDFRNLLGAMLGTVSHLSRLPPDTRLSDPDVREGLGDAEVVIARGQDLTKQLLRFARQQETRRASLDTGELISEVMQIVKASMRQVRTQLTLEPNLHVVGDRSQLHQVVLNLCTNARDAMPSGGQLRISTRMLQQEGPNETTLPALRAGPYVVVSVEDTGEGMDSATIQRIFEPFFTTKGPEKGTGMGLATVFGIVGSHGGGIEVDSSIGRGTTFRVYLPQAPDSAQI